MIEIDFKKYKFNPLYFELEKYIYDHSIYTFLIYGGKSSSKSYTVSQITLIDLLRGRNTISFRKESARVSTTIQRTYSDAVSFLNLTDGIRELQFEFRYNKNHIKLSGLDDEGKIKGIENYHNLYFDELDQFTLQEFRQGEASLRGKPNQKIFGTWNPISENHWIKKEIIDKTEWLELDHSLPSPDSWIKQSKDGHTILVKTDYRDNHWIVGNPKGEDKGYRDERLISLYESYKVKDPHFYKVNVLGEWGVIQNDSPFFYNYNRNIHVGKTRPPDKRYTLKLSFDFNVGSTYCIIYQFIPVPRSEGGGFYVYKTLRGKDTKDLCNRIKDYLRWQDGAVWGGSRNVTITGDSTGKNRTAVAGNLDNYQIILKELKLSRRALRDVSGVNQRHVYSRTIVNDFFVSIPVLINESTNEDLIYDIETAYFDDDSANIKKDRKDNPQDAGDCFRYAINECVPLGIKDIEKYSKIIEKDYYLSFT